jgi:hypothetical protein
MSESSLHLRVRASWPRHLIAWAIGVTLIAAGLMKAAQWVSDPNAENALPPLLAFQLAAVLSELALGFWLLSGIRPRAAWSVAVIAFTVFQAMTTRDALEGKASCACFGSLSTRPLFVAAFDLLAIICLVAFFPKEQPVRRSIRVAAVLLLFLVSIPSAALMLMAERTKLAATPVHLDMGVTPAGGSSASWVILSNETGRQIDIATVETSCRCLTLHLPTRMLSPGEHAQAEIVFAPPGAGSQTLAMWVRGYDCDGRLLFSLTVAASCP